MIQFNPPKQTPINSPAETGSGSGFDETAERNWSHLRETIVQDYDRMDETSSFRFGCHPGVPCFNKCCSDINIFLTPYDVVRLKNRLKMPSQQFLAAYTMMPVHEMQKHPVIMLKMRDDENKTCPFVDAEKGCTVYEDRPWACRMFPVGKASPSEGSEETQFYFLMNEDVCRGWEESTEWTVGQWIEDQQVARWDEEGEKYKTVALHPWFNEQNLTPQQMDMYYMVCYDLDRFRRFVFESSLLKRIEVDPKAERKMAKSDAHLLDFGYKWLRFSVFQEPVLKVKRQ